MCGIIGFSGNKKELNTNTIIKIMKANESRGKDSCGFYNGTEIVRVIGLTKNLKKGINNSNTKNTNIFVGHTRHSTHGKICVKNQHPFKYGNVIGIHNGVVNNYREVGEEHDFEKTDVDSQMIFKVLNKTQNIHNVGLFNNSLATLFTMNGERLYAYRKNNPLYVGRDNKGNAYFSSLKEVLQQCNLIQIFELMEGRMYAFNNGKIIAKMDIKHKPIASKYQTTYKRWYEYGNNDYNNNYNSYFNSRYGNDVNDDWNSSQIKGNYNGNTLFDDDEKDKPRLIGYINKKGDWITRKSKKKVKRKKAKFSHKNTNWKKNLCEGLQTDTNKSDKWWKVMGLRNPNK